jgi:hypothetical protein
MADMVVSFHIGLQCWNDQKASLFGRNFDRFAMEIYRMKIGGCWGFHSTSSRFFNARPNHPFVVFVAGPFATLHYWTICGTGTIGMVCMKERLPAEEL